MTRTQYRIYLEMSWQVEAQNEDRDDVILPEVLRLSAVHPVAARIWLRLLRGPKSQPLHPPIQQFGCI